MRFFLIGAVSCAARPAHPFRGPALSPLLTYRQGWRSGVARPTCCPLSHESRRRTLRPTGSSPDTPRTPAGRTIDPSSFLDVNWPLARCHSLPSGVRPQDGTLGSACSFERRTLSASRSARWAP